MRTELPATKELWSTRRHTPWNMWRLPYLWPNTLDLAKRHFLDQFCTKHSQKESWQSKGGMLPGSANACSQRKNSKEKCPQSVFQFEVWHCFPRHLLGSDLEPWSMRCRSWQLLWGDMKPNTVSWCEELLEVSSQPPFKVLSPSVQLRRVQPLTPASWNKDQFRQFCSESPWIPRRALIWLIWSNMI